LRAKKNEKLAFLHVSYGQRTEERERRALKNWRITTRLSIGLPSIEYLARIGGSSLTDQSIPIAAADLSSNEIPTSYVPFRNAHLLAIATSWAEVLARRIYRRGGGGFQRLS
jgi:7-cyano-7-deazaguanine synthase